MAMTLNKFMEKLGVGYVLQSYETIPWSHTDSEKNLTVNADIAMNADQDELEAEIMYLHDDPQDGQPPVKLALWMRIRPHTGDQWKITDLKFNNEDHLNKIHDWESNACDVFRVCVKTIQRGEVPDFDEILQDEFFKGGAGGRRGGRGGGKKAPIVKPEQMPGMNRGKM